MGGGEEILKRIIEAFGFSFQALLQVSSSDVADILDYNESYFWYGWELHSRKD